MNSFADLLEPGTIKLALEGKRKNEALEELIGLLHRAGKIEDPQATLKGLIQREKLASTGIGSGIAIPHLLSPDVRQTAMAFGRKREGLRFDSVDNQPVTLIFLIVGPKHQEYAHLRLLSHLSRLLHDSSFRRTLMEADTAEKILQAVRRKDDKEG